MSRKSGNRVQVVGVWSSSCASQKPGSTRRAKPIARDRLYGEDIGTGPLGLLGNIVWFVLAGWWLALGHLFAAVGLAITIIGLPFAWAHLKLAGFSLWPIGRTIAHSDIRRRAY